MTNVADTVRPSAPWHLWVVGGLALIWSAASCYSYVMTRTANAGYFESTGLTPEMVAYFGALPAWYIVAWTIGVWSELLATFGLLIRRPWSVWLFAISMPAMLAMSVATMLNEYAREMLGQVGLIFTAMTVFFSVFEVLYSMAMRKNGVLH